jgi:ankyrin repeat protein
MDESIVAQRIELNPSITYTLALHSAIREYDRHVVEAVLAAGADVNWRDADGQTALFLCSMFDSRDGEQIAADLILARPECEIELPDAYGVTPLRNAEFRQRPHTAALIRAALADRATLSASKASPRRPSRVPCHNGKRIVNGK